MKLTSKQIAAKLIEIEMLKSRESAAHRIRQIAQYIAQPEYFQLGILVIWQQRHAIETHFPEAWELLNSQGLVRNPDAPRPKHNPRRNKKGGK